MPKPIIWSPQAENDFSNILHYLDENWGKNVVNGFIDLTEHNLIQLAARPRLFPYIHKKRKIRKCVLTRHNTIYYREDTTQINILRIYDTRQDPEKLSFK